ncbi:MAG: hemolysin family protein [Clostridia bacterium]|nr:hemolysin family protein [Clostridia bacterium]
MDTHSMISIAAIVVLLIMSAFFSATETAFTSLSRVRIKNLAGDGNKRASLVLSLSEQFDKLLSTILIGNNIVNIVMTAVATLLFVKLYGEYGPTISTIIITVVVLIFGEISPKSLAKENAERFAMIVAPVLSFFMVLFTPLNFIFSMWKILLSKVFNVTGQRTITEDELITMVEEAETEGGIDTEQSELIQNAIEFNELEAWDVLSPRVDMEAIDIATEKSEIERMFRETGYSRLPVYRDDLDTVLGVLNIKDFYNYVINSDRGIEAHVKPVVFVAGSIKIAALLKKMQSEKTHMAIVVDEYGGTEGIVTMEDIIEELVGEIWDEHDRIIPEGIVARPDGTYLVQGSANIDKTLDFFDIEEEINATTVNGWAAIELDKLPVKGDYFEYTSDEKLLRVTVTESDGRKAVELSIAVEDLSEAEE